MKKIILLLVIVVSGAWWIFSTKPLLNQTIEEKSEELSPEEILQNDYSVLVKNLKQENISNEEWKKINNYSLAVDQVVTKDNALGFFQASQNNLPDLYSCLKKDFCGMRSRGENDAYFDDQRTPAHLLINRSLKVLKESLRKDPSLISKVNWELIQDLASSDAELIQVEAVDILSEFDSENLKTDELIKLTQDYKGVAKADSLVRIAKSQKNSDKRLVALDVEEVFAMSDSHTVISVLEKMGELNLSSQEIERALKNLCRFKDNENEAHNWSMIKYEAKKLKPDFEKNCN